MFLMPLASSCYHIRNMLIQFDYSFLSNTKWLRLNAYSAEIICEAPQAGGNTELIPSEIAQSGLAYLETYTYTCLSGYETEDELCTVCMPNGMLSLEYSPNCTSES